VAKEVVAGFGSGLILSEHTDWSLGRERTFGMLQINIDFFKVGSPPTKNGQTGVQSGR